MEKSYSIEIIASQQGFMQRARSSMVRLTRHVLGECHLARWRFRDRKQDVKRC